MRMKVIVGIASALLAVSAIGASAASAATEFGDNCVGNETTEPSAQVTLFAITAAGDPLPLAAPSAGVITKWKLNLVPAPVALPQTLKVVRQTGPLTVQVIGDSAQTITGGANSFDTRIPVQAGDRLGLASPAESPLVFCKNPGPENRLGAFLGAPPGSTAAFEEIESEARVPVSAVLEPDADNDGYGDETQDKCPQNPAVQAACPVVSLNASAIAKKTLVKALVTASLQAPVTVKGSVKLGKGKAAKLSGGTQIVAPGVISRFTLLFPGKLKSKLEELSKKRFLSLKLTVTGTNPVGAPTIRTLKVKLKGQAKPKPRKKPKSQK